MNQEVSRTVAQALLRVKAVKLQPKDPFTWASGWKAPIYCDNRKTLSFPQERNYIKQAFSQIVKEQFPQAECIAGVATGAIAWGALVADELGLPFVYIRSTVKDHGMKNLIEGFLPQKSKVVVIEDLISTGGSSLKAVQAIQDAEADPLALLAVYTHAFPQSEALFTSAQLPVITLSDYETVINEAVKENYISPNEIEILKQWRTNPAQWGINL